MIRNLFTFLLFSFCTLLFMPSTLKAEDVETTSAIKSVTVYNNRAKVSRDAVVNVPKGAHNVIIKSLPISLMPDSLRVKGSAKANVTLGAITHKRVISRDLTAAREKDLNNKIQTLQDQTKLINAEKKALNTQHQFLKNIAQQAQLRSDEAIAELKLNSSEWSAASAEILSQTSQILKAHLHYDIKLRDLNKEIQALRKELNQFRTGQKSVYDVSVALESDAATQLTLSLSYQTSGATWRPIYDARLNAGKDGEADLELVQYGSVTQSTGEDWNDVSLTLSTAQPHRNATIGDLHPQWIDIYRPRKRRNMAYDMEMGMNQSSVAGMAMKAESPSADFADMDEEDMMLEEKEMAYASVAVQKHGFVAEYTIPGPSSVLSNGTQSKLRIGTSQTKSELQVHIKPQLSQSAFIVAKVTLEGDTPLLAGSMNLYRDGAFIGRSHLPLLNPGKEHYLSFGIDDQVTFKHKTLKDMKKDAGMILSDNMQERHFVTTIENHHARPVNIVLQQRVPVSKNEDIKFDLLKDKTTPGFETDWNNVKGVMSWNLNLAPQAKESVKLGWKVEWPKGAQLSGSL